MTPARLRSRMDALAARASRVLATWAGAWLCSILLALPAPAEPLLPEDAVRRAIALHPNLKRAHSLTEAAEAYIKGAGALPNPILQISGVVGDPDENSNSLIQTLEIGGQPGLRRRTAEESARASAASEEALRRGVALEAASAYYEVWQNASLEDLARLQLELARSLESTASQRLLLGEISPNEHFRAQLLLGQAQASLAQAEADARVSRQTLALLLEVDGPIEMPARVGDLPAAPEYGLPQDFDGIFATDAAGGKGAAIRPEVEAAQREAAASQLEADLAARAGAPSLQLSAYRSTLGHAQEQGVQLSVVIPLFDWGQLGARHAQQEKLAEARRY